jgi:hypothetical protein
MPVEDFKIKILNSLIQVAGTVITQQFKPDTAEEEERLVREYYKKATRIAKSKDKKIEKEDEEIVKEIKTKKVEMRETADDFEHDHDMTDEKITGGTACLACSRDHFSGASSMLSEALRFARERPMTDNEITSRIGLALDELNALERMDLCPSKIEPLKGTERKIAEDALKKSREIRHKITLIRTTQDLESVSAEIANIKTSFMKKIFEMSDADGTFKKLCLGRGYDEDELQKCKERIYETFNKKG